GPRGVTRPPQGLIWGVLTRRRSWRRPPLHAAVRRVPRIHTIHSRTRSTTWLTGPHPCGSAG
ncbi:hypothetical protein AB0M20_40960, partial [Actinoplanes sp. NPDC051633]|uniref:hypothetical protein n=1 Tax=Actinoplanes sp. NPDC051633 TaxID=3155670 RepID=UPI003417D56A